MVRSREYAEYVEASGWRALHPRRSWLRTARLDVVGWSALLGMCVVAAAAGVAATTALGRPGRYGAAGAVVPLVAVVLVDRRRWARMRSSFGWGGSAEDVGRVVALLEARGIHTEVLIHDIAHPWREPAHPGDDRSTPASLQYLNRDAAAVAELLRARGIRFLPPR